MWQKLSESFLSDWREQVGAIHDEGQPAVTDSISIAQVVIQLQKPRLLTESSRISLV